MSRFIIRNDDVAYDTTLDEIKTFCEICDEYGFKIIQAITPIGEVQKVRRRMTNEQIRAQSQKYFHENEEVSIYLRSRDDDIAVHGLWHTHSPMSKEIRMATIASQYNMLWPTYFVPPFNEGDYPDDVCGLALCQLSRENGDCLEDFLDSGTPTSPIMYLHSWRFKGKPYTFSQLEACLRRLQ